MATLETSPEANYDGRTRDGRTRDGQEKRLIGARATALPKKNNNNNLTNNNYYNKTTSV